MIELISLTKPILPGSTLPKENPTHLDSVRVYPFQFRYAEFNAGTVSLYLMIIAVVSGFIGRYLYRRMDERGKKIFKYWRDVHVPLVGILILSIAIHIVRP